jgi:hypothetical protein
METLTHLHIDTSTHTEICNKNSPTNQTKSLCFGYFSVTTGSANVAAILGRQLACVGQPPTNAPVIARLVVLTDGCTYVNKFQILLARASSLNVLLKVDSA